MTDIQSYDQISAERRERAVQNITPERQAHLKALFQQLEGTVVKDALDVGDQVPDFTLREAGTGEGHGATTSGWEARLEAWA